MGSRAIGGAAAARIALGLALLVATPLLASPAAAVCGDGTVDLGEECDDGNTVAADGCSPGCQFEQLCVVTNNFGSPGSASVVELGRDGSLEVVTGSATPSPHTGSLYPAATRCGRFVYLLSDSAIEGFEVALDGTLTPLPSVAAPVTNTFRGVICNEEQELLFVPRLVETFLFSLGYVDSYQVGAAGGLTLADSAGTAAGGVVFGTFPDLHPTTGDLYLLSNADPPTGGADESLFFERFTYDAGGNIALAQGVQLTFSSSFAWGMRLTRDAGFLAIPGYEAPAPTECFAHWDAPGVTIPPAMDLHVDCASLPQSPTGFEVGPAGTPVFYYQSAGGALQAVEFSGSTIAPQTSITPTHETRQLLLAYGGEVLVSLGPADLATYEIAPDLVTLTPGDQVSLAAAPDAGVLIACPALAPPPVPLPAWLPALLAGCLSAIPVFLSARRRARDPRRFPRVPPPE